MGDKIIIGEEPDLGEIMIENKLYYGDNLDILRNREYFPNECVDLIYLDPPFNSNRSYNVLFKDESGRDSDAQIVAFGDTWHWGPSAEKTYSELITRGTSQVSKTIGSLREFLGTNQMMAYLVMMTARLAEMHRVLKQTGSIYLHCDPTASHYLKMILDTIFGAENFRNEIVWKRTFAHGNVGRNYGSITDIIFWYSKTGVYCWNQQYVALSPEEIEEKYPHVDSDGRRWQSVTLRNPGPRPNLHFPYTASNGVTYLPHPNGWACNLERLQRYDRENRLHFPSKPDGALRLKMYADESPGEKLQNIWDDIPPLGAQAKERLGYPTQKPLALLERIISTSSNPGDVVLDPFCGCGTAIAAAQKLGRKWIGIDITVLSVTLQKYRLRDMFALYPKKGYMVIGEPTTVSEARALAMEESDKQRLQFQKWALSLVQAKPIAVTASGDVKPGKDKGVDGVINFIDDTTNKSKEVLVQIKSGKVSSAYIRDLRGTMERRKSSIGVFITLEEATRDMLTEAISAGFYHSPGWGKDYPKIQILTIEQLLSGAEVKMPPPFGTFKQAERVKNAPDMRNMTLDEAPRNGEES